MKKSSVKNKKGNPLSFIASAVIKIYVLLGFITRVVFMLFPPEGSSFSILETLKLFCLGFVNDIAMGIILCLPLLLLYTGLFDFKYKKIPGIAILALLVAGIAYTVYPRSIFHEYGGGAPGIAIGFLIYKLVSFSLRYFIPSIRAKWRLVSYYVIWGVYLMVLLINAVGEWFFWQEFGVRYNFIAVDYLVYTHEVIGNILESYAITPIMIGLILLTLFIMWLTCKFKHAIPDTAMTLRGLLVHGALLIGLSVLSYFQLAKLSPLTEGENLCVNQLQQNGAFDFFQAFSNHQLEYDRFYTLLSEEECRDGWKELCATDNRIATDAISGEWQQMLSVPKSGVNVVLITVESLSASFLTAYGNDKGLTPSLDTLMQQGMVFDSLYAVGNRTVRGLEALSLCIPPCAGESIVKRKNNRMGTLSTGHLFTSLGYQVLFLYGGDSYFDNMGDYFGNNSYQVIDRKDINSDSIVFANIWGVSDEDLYNKALSVFDSNKKPFFAQLMTTSNHRPYTYPDNRITFDGNPKSRNAAVKYTDYAIGRFISDARSHAWFDNTIFIIIADHCASSAGKTSIPVDKYHIPCIVYAPKMVKPCHVRKRCSQIDIIPTLLAMLHIDKETGFAGRNILSDNCPQRAFMATYQDLGYYQGNTLTVLSPVRKIRQYLVEEKEDGKHSEQLIETTDTIAVKQAQIYYQYSNLYLNQKLPE